MCLPPPSLRRQLPCRGRSTTACRTPLLPMLSAVLPIAMARNSRPQLLIITASSNSRCLLDVQGFLRCAPPALSNLGLAAFVSTAGRKAGDTIANLTVTPATTMVADILATTSQPDIQARATALTNALTAGDADLTLLADAETTLYNAQLANRLNVDFSGGSEGSDSGDSGGGGSGGAGATGGDSGGAGGDAGDGGAFSPIPGAVCDFGLTMDGPMVRTGALADFLATGTVNGPDLQTIALQVNAAFAGRQASLAAVHLGRSSSMSASIARISWSQSCKVIPPNSCNNKAPCSMSTPSSPRVSHPRWPLYSPRQTSPPHSVRSRCSSSSRTRAAALARSSGRIDGVTLGVTRASSPRAGRGQTMTEAQRLHAHARGQHRSRSWPMTSVTWSPRPRRHAQSL